MTELDDRDECAVSVRDARPGRLLLAALTLARLATAYPARGRDGAPAQKA